VFTEGLDLPRGRERETVLLGDETYNLNGSEVRTLATVGAFRIMAVDDLRDDRDQPGALWKGDLRRLRASGLITTVAPTERDTRTPVVTLTERGKGLLEAHRSPDHEPAQTFHAGVLRTRELAHDTQVYRAFERSAERQAERDARILRIVLEQDLKREYQRFLQDPNRGRSDSDGRVKRTPEEVRQWAEEHDLSVRDGHVQFPDLRLELEMPDGRREIEDIEVTTLHYRGLQASGKASAGFTRYRSSGGRIGGRGGRSGGRRGPDPHLAEEVLR
jgi:DNA-binding MarR family transcriptional regulator